MFDGDATVVGSSHRLTGLMKNRAYSDLKRLILDETFAVGSLLSERQLAARLKMSKTPIKSALERLEAEGFIGVAPQHGIRVHDLTPQEVVHLFELREVLESYVARQVAQLRMTPEQIELVKTNLAASAQAAEARDSAATPLRRPGSMPSFICCGVSSWEIRKSCTTCNACATGSIVPSAGLPPAIRNGCRTVIGNITRSRKRFSRAIPNEPRVWRSSTCPTAAIFC